MSKNVFNENTCIPAFFLKWLVTYFKTKGLDLTVIYNFETLLRRAGKSYFFLVVGSGTLPLTSNPFAKQHQFLSCILIICNSTFKDAFIVSL